jgi:crotonobetainyl-CoA:carnitine CoA-transferase CaiB-like acyl-CoA transferase
MTTYPCADGELLYIFAVDNAKIARRLIDVLGLAAQVEEAGLVFCEPYADDRRDNLAEASNLTRRRQSALKSMIADVLVQRSAQTWETELNAAGVPCAVQRTLAEWAALPELRVAGLIRTAEDGAQIAGPMIWQTEGPPPPSPAPTMPNAAAKLGSSWLSGTTVIDLCSMVAGPVATRTLAEYGAEVIKVEPPSPNHGPRLTCWYALDTGQGKRSTLIDLTTPGGREAMNRLINRADVLVTNHSAGALDALGLSDNALKKCNPGLIRCRISAYGGPRPGPWDDRPGYDPVLQAASGIMVRYGDPGAPELHGIASCVDALTGYAAAFAVAAALRARDQDGQGRAVATSLAAAATLIQAPLLSGSLPDVGGQNCRGTGPTHHLYRARDGWLFLDAPDRKATDLPLRFRPAGQEDPRAGIARRVRKSSLAQACTTLAAAGFPAVPVRSIRELQAEWLIARQNTVPRLVRRDVPGVGPVVTAPPCQVLIDGTPLDPLLSAEKPGASTRAVLAELGLDADKMIAEGEAAEALSDVFLPG